MTAILKHNLDMPWEASPAQQSLKLKKACLTPRPFTMAPRSPWGVPRRRTTLALEKSAQRTFRTNPAVLRALREAELAAWNKAAPRTAAPARTPAAAQVREASKAIIANEKAELPLFYVVTAIAALAVVQGFWGLSGLLERWSAFADFVSGLFASN
jgi:hypothetical protein